MPGTTEYRIVTPDDARELLSHNHGNRRVRQTWVKYLARQIVNGKWELTSDAVGIRRDGVVINGQHRLMAIVEADVAVPMIVVRGLSAEAFLVTDRGKSRSLTDVLKLPTTLIADANLIAEALNYPRLAESEVLDVLAWWRPAHAALAKVNGAKFQSGFSSAAFRIGAGLRWASEPGAADRQYVLEQYSAVTSSRAPEMSVAGAALWKRWLRHKPGGGAALRRVQGVTIAYYYLDPRKADTAPLIKNPDALMIEVRDGLCRLEDMFLAAPVGASHPYLPVDDANTSQVRGLRGVAVPNRDQASA
jgi:hypothetical protein